jgi:hypothetical protein
LILEESSRIKFNKKNEKYQAIPCIMKEIEMPGLFSSFRKGYCIISVLVPEEFALEYSKELQ